MNSEPHLLDLEMVRDRLRGIRDKLQAELATLPAGDPKADRLFGSWVAIRGVLADEIEPMLEGWREGIPQSRKAERLINGEAPKAE